MYDSNIWWHVFQLIIFISLVGVFLYKIFENYLRVNLVIYVATVLIYMVITGVIILVCLTEISPYKDFRVSGINLIIVLSIVVIKLLVKKHSFSLLFLFFLFLNLQYNTISLAKATVEFEFVPRIVAYKAGNILLISSLYSVAVFPIIYYLLIKLYKRIIDEKIEFKGMELLFCLPAGFFFATGMFMELNYKPPIRDMEDTLMPLIMISICALGSCFAVVKSVIASYDASVKHEQLYAAEVQQILLEEQYDNLQIKVSAEARARHDWKYHIITILGFVEMEDLDGLREYLGEYKDKYLQPEMFVLCDVTAIDMLFQYYKRKAQELGITIDINTVLLAECKIDTSDLVVVFGNLLSNAIEACEQVSMEKKYISLKIKNNHNDIIAIICENNFNGVVNKKSNKIISRKKDGGIGLASVSAIADKNNGMMEVEVNKQVFKVYVALKN